MGAQVGPKFSHKLLLFNKTLLLTIEKLLGDIPLQQRPLYNSNPFTSISILYNYVFEYLLSSCD